ncbi:hypothetical protein M514_06469, partial [Trichuris suis]
MQLVYFIPSVFVLYIVASRELTWFSLHPVLMTAAYLLVVAEALSAFSGRLFVIGTPSSYKFRTRTHIWLMAFAVLLSSFAFYVIYTRKAASNKPHFATWHGFIGAIVFIHTLFQVCSGAVLNCAGFIRFTRAMRLVGLRAIHALSGCLLYLLGCFVILLGFFSRWFMNCTTPALRQLCVCSVVLSCVCVVYAVGMRAVSRIRAVLKY